MNNKTVYRGQAGRLSHVDFGVVISCPLLLELFRGKREVCHVFWSLWMKQTERRKWSWHRKDGFQNTAFEARSLLLFYSLISSVRVCVCLPVSVHVCMRMVSDGLGFCHCFCLSLASGPMLRKKKRGKRKKFLDLQQSLIKSLLSSRASLIYHTFIMDAILCLAGCKCRVGRTSECLTDGRFPARGCVLVLRHVWCVRFARCIDG